jgi:hypothetical protein
MLVSAASTVQISAGSTTSVALASDRMLRVHAHPITGGMISYHGKGRDQSRRGTSSPEQALNTAARLAGSADAEYEAKHIPSGECRVVKSVWGQMAPMNPVDAPAIDGRLLELLVDWAPNAVVPLGFTLWRV